MLNQYFPISKKVRQIKFQKKLQLNEINHYELISQHNLIFANYQNNLFENIAWAYKLALIQALVFEILYYEIHSKRG